MSTFSSRDYLSGQPLSDPSLASPHQLHVGELLCQGVRVVADGEDVLLDGRGLGFEGHQLVRDGGGIDGDLKAALFPLAHQDQPLVELLQHLIQGFPVSLREEVIDQCFIYQL